MLALTSMNAVGQTKKFEMKSAKDRMSAACKLTQTEKVGATRARRMSK